MEVVYLINVELGWDNVVGIFTDTPENRKYLSDYCKENDGHAWTSSLVKNDAKGWLE